MKRNKSKRLIKELVKRRDEVAKRAKMVANKRIPEHLIDSQLAEIMEWIVQPHIVAEYDNYNKPSNTEVRGFQKILQKILKRSKNDNKKAD